MQVGEEEFFQILQEEVEKDFDPLELVYPKEVPVFEKYDEYVPEELVRKGFALGVLDVEDMKRRCGAGRRTEPPVDAAGLLAGGAFSFGGPCFLPARGCIMEAFAALRGWIFWEMGLCL